MAKQRTPISKKLRFDVFKRDGFACQYCGNTPPTVVLEIDHIIPVAKKGSNEIDNLLTSCFDCNRGKSDRELSSLPQSTFEKTALLIEKEEQYRAFKRIQNKIKKRIDSEVESLNQIYKSYFPKYCLTDKFKNSSVSHFIKSLGFSAVEDAMHLACSKINDDTRSIDYFCGICWNKIKGTRR